MRRSGWIFFLVLCVASNLAGEALGQATPYIGYAYPAGGQRGTTVQVKLGGQRLDGLESAVVSGEGVAARVVEYFRPMSNQEMSLVREQLNELRRQVKQSKGKNRAAAEFIERIDGRMAEYCNRPACASISAIVFVEVTIDSSAEPGDREIRLVTSRGVSNPLVFQVGQVPEVSRKPMKTCVLQVLGKEEQSLRKRPEEEVEVRLEPPCTANGQIGSGEVNRYRFEASRGQRLVISAAARHLIPYIADAVPGWFQPVLMVHDQDGREVAYNDDFRFKPDPTLLFEVPSDGEYVVTITDALYRGREDFVYRLTIGQLPQVTSVFPLGGPAGSFGPVEIEGWNLGGAEAVLPPRDAETGVHSVAAVRGEFVSNSVPFAIDDLPEARDRESNENIHDAQPVDLPAIINGRMDRPGDTDVFRVAGRAGQTLVAEVVARRLDSPLDSILRITDSRGRLLAINDDHEDAGSGLNTHHADSYLMLELPADGDYYVHLGDTALNGGPEFAYRLRLSEPRPDFELRIVPSGIAMRGKGTASVSVYAIRKDGFQGDIKLALRGRKGFSAAPATLKADKEMVPFPIKSTLTSTSGPVALVVEGRSDVDRGPIVRRAVPAEDRMQAFLWRHLVPAQTFEAVVYNPSYQPPAERVPPELKPEDVPKPDTKSGAEPPKFTKRQVAGRLRQLKTLYEEWLLTDDFYLRKVAECHTVQ